MATKATTRPPPGFIKTGESFWVNHYQWLEGCGYKLRPRYAPDWVPSWQGASNKKLWIECEDGQSLPYEHLGDAVRIHDGTFVSLKMFEKPVHPYEAEIGRFFSSEPLASDARNHCVPIYDVLQVPDDEKRVILVMPFLRIYDKPRFDTFGEAVEYFRQVFEGLQFMHKHNVAHRDCSGNNIMMDATRLYPDSWHPADIDLKRDYSGKAKRFTRSQRPVKYYFVDFGISRRFDPENGPPRAVPIWGGDKTVPEFQKSNDACDPFPTDVYYIGNMIRVDFLQGMPEFHHGMYGFEFMEPLVADMVQDDPSKRPTMDEVVARFEVIRKSLSAWKLRSRVVKRDDNPIVGVFRSVSHWTRRLGFVVRRVPAIPSPT